MLDVPIKLAAHPNSPAYAVIEQATIHRGNPEVTRTVTSIIRRSDGALIARSVIYGRYGGDFPSHAEPSGFACPRPRDILNDLQPMFVFTDE